MQDDEELSSLLNRLGRGYVSRADLSGNAVNAIRILGPNMRKARQDWYSCIGPLSGLPVVELVSKSRLADRLGAVGLYSPVRERILPADHLVNV